MTIGVTSIEEQLAQMNEAIARLTQIVEEKDLQIAALVSRLEPQDDENPNPEDEPTVERIDKKPELDQAAALMGSLSIQQLQEMIRKPNLKVPRRIYSIYVQMHVLYHQHVHWFT